MIGIDISEHNGYVDFEKVKNNGIDFVILRLGWIGNKENHTLDKYFLDYYNRAKLVGLQIGVYVYSYCKSIDTMRSGANWAINKIKENNINLDKAMFIDMEDNTIIECGKEILTNQVVEFCKIIENNGIKAGVYANKNWFENYLDINKLISYKIWLAEWNEKENHSANFKVDLWQYSSNGSVEGVTGRVDMNKCLNCQKTPETTEEDKKEGFEVKMYVNGTSREDVFQDSDCKTIIGYLHPHEIAECYGIINNKALIVYNRDNSNYKKAGFVKWLGGIR